VASQVYSWFKKSQKKSKWHKFVQRVGQPRHVHNDNRCLDDDKDDDEGPIFSSTAETNNDDTLSSSSLAVVILSALCSFGGLLLK